jgi:transposase
MAKPLVTDELWAVIEPLLPKRRPRPKDGRPIVDDHAALQQDSGSRFETP